MFVCCVSFGLEWLVFVAVVQHCITPPIDQHLSSSLLHSDVRAGALMAFTRAGGPRAKLYTMHQFLEFDVAETDGIRVLDGSSASFFQKGTATYAVPCDAAWDRQLLGHRLEFCVLDESDLAGDAYVGMASMLLSPLLSRRGMRANLSLYDPDGQVSGQLKVEVAWDPEPIPPKVSRNDANRHVLEGIVRSVRALGPGKESHASPNDKESPE